MNGFVVPIQKQIIKKIIREVPKAKCHECSKQHKSESSNRSFGNTVTWILSGVEKRAACSLSGSPGLDDIPWEVLLICFNFLYPQIRTR